MFGAVRQVVQASNEQQLRQTAATLAQARKAIYLMLAEVGTSVEATESSDEKSPDEESPDEDRGAEG